MDTDEDPDYQSHQSRIKDVDISFALADRAIESFGKLCNSEDVSDQDEHAGRIDTLEVAYELLVQVSGDDRRTEVDTTVECRRSDHKVCRDQNLQDESDDGHFFAQLCHRCRSRALHTSAGDLDEKTKDVECDEDLGQPFGSDQRVAWFGIHGGDDAC